MGPANDDKAGTHAEASADATRERILAAALDLFSERAFDGASTREIAARAGRDPAAAQLPLQLEGRAVASGGRRPVRGARRGPRRTRRRSAGRRRADRRRGSWSGSSSTSRPHTRSCTGSSPRSARATAPHGLAGRAARPPAVRAGHGAVRPAGRAGPRPAIPPAHLYYILTGAGPTMFVLAPECRRLSGLDPAAAEVIEAHADAVSRSSSAADRKEPDATRAAARLPRHRGAGPVVAQPVLRRGHRPRRPASRPRRER